MKVIVIGGVAAGMSAAAKLKRLKKDVTIHVYEKGTDLSYGACGMPYYLSDIIPDAKSLVARTQEAFKKDGIEVFVNHEVVGVDPENKKVKIKHQNNMIEDTYDKLIIATGAHAIRLPVPGSDLSGIHVLNSLEDAKNLKEALQKAQTIGVIGAGFIGCEVAENLIHMKKNVIVIERLDQVLGIYDKDMSLHAQEALEQAGVDLKLSEDLIAYEGDTHVTHIKTNQNTYAVDLVIEAIGVRPNTSFLKDTNMKRLKNGAIVINEHMETSVKDIYAAGDCVAYQHQMTKASAYVPLGTHANKGGRVIASQIAGIDDEFQGIIGSNVVKVMDLTVAKTGFTMKEVKAHNLNYQYVDVTANNHAGYYPNAEKIHMRIVYEPKTLILKGAQLIGKKGVSDRINVMAVAITNQMTAKAFSQLDLAYAPPFSSVWDPLQIATNQII
ncbi:MAG: CoA-disulfide reductase [Acholeplasmataceae bacterium]